MKDNRGAGAGAAEQSRRVLNGLDRVRLNATTAAFLVLLAGATAGCAPKLGIQGTQAAGLPLCTPFDKQGVKLIMRIYLHRKLDDIIDPQHENKDIYYDRPIDEPNGTPLDHDFAKKGVQNSSSYSVGGVDIANNIYHSDLTNLDPGYQLSGGQKVEYRVIIEDKDNPNDPHDHGSNMTFYTHQDNITPNMIIRGVGVDPHSQQGFICSDDVKQETYGNEQRDVASFYLYYRGGGGPTLDGFNIVIVPRRGSQDTPVLIDPKILNNG